MSHKFNYTKEIKREWQSIITALAEIFKVPCALLMRKHEKQIEVFVKSDTNGNPYEAEEMANLDTGLYCETVMNTKNKLCVPNALTDPCWDKNPDIKLGMISYLGLPIIHPTGEVFGTICVLDNKENGYNKFLINILNDFKMLIEADMNRLYLHEQLIEKKDELIQAKEIALREVISTGNKMRDEVVDNVSLNLAKSILPLLDEMGRDCKMKNGCQKYFSLLESYILDIGSNFNRKILSLHNPLTSSEIKVCNMIKKGLLHKEIAHLIGITESTVKNHVVNIKQKLNIKGKKISLKEYFNSQDFSI